MRKYVFRVLMLIGIILALNSVYYVNEGEYAIIKRFDKVVNIRENSGVGIKIPVIDAKSSLSKKLLMYDLAPSEVLTKDKKSMIADTYTVWRIVNPLKFLQTVGNVREVERRLDATVYGSLKTTIGSINQADIIESRTNDGLDEMILAGTGSSLDNYGIELVGLQIKKYDLPSGNKNAVFERMISERNQIAASFTAEGQEEANKIRNTADKEKSIIISEAKARSAELIAEGESEYMKVLASAYNSADRADFYKFLRTLDALNTSLKGDKTLILQKDSDLVKGLVGTN